MGNVAIIPARGGSKRIPRKNIKDFFGKPIIAYSIEIAKRSELFSNIIVSTDDEEIADIAIKYGANVPFLRSAENSNDYSTTAAVIAEVLTSLKDYSSLNYINSCCIYPTAPLINVEKLQEGYKLLVNKNRDTVFPVLKFSYPIWRGLEFVNDGIIKMLWPEFENSRSQDLKETFHDAGQWYWFNINAFKKQQTFFTKNTSSIVLSEFEAQDIDNLEDWFIAEQKYQFIRKNRNYEKI